MKVPSAAECLASVVVGSRAYSLIALTFAVIAHLTGSTVGFWVVVVVALTEMGGAMAMQAAGVRTIERMMKQEKILDDAMKALETADEVIRAIESDTTTRLRTPSEN